MQSTLGTTREVSDIPLCHLPTYIVSCVRQEVIEEQKELVLAGERLVLTTLGFDLNIHHPYKPLVAAIKRFKAQKTLAQVAWNFVNDR